MELVSFCLRSRIKEAPESFRNFLGLKGALESVRGSYQAGLKLQEDLHTTGVLGGSLDIVDKFPEAEFIEDLLYPRKACSAKMIRAEGLRLTALSLWPPGAEPTLLNPGAPFSFFFSFHLATSQSYLNQDC